MAITPSIYNSLVFGGVNSADYGIYITGEGVYNAPARSVEYVSVPGRNGAVALDQGHFENVTVTYPAGVFGNDQQEFREALSDYRNAILSQVGYQRLSDTYHPDEYRLGIYADGLEVKPTIKQQGTAGEFDLTFNCKPQRYLTSGETAITVSSGNTITNPTAFGSHPLLAVKGYGAITIGEQVVELTQADIGYITLVKSETARNAGISPLYLSSRTFSMALLNTGDVITVSGLEVTFSCGGDLTSSVSITNWSGISGVINKGDKYRYTASFPNFILGYKTGPADPTQSKTFTATLKITDSGGTLHNYSLSLTVSQSDYTRVSGISIELTVSGVDAGYIQAKSVSMKMATAYSTVSGLGNPTYIDCEVGEAYMYSSGTVISLNGSVDIGYELPELSSGVNEITYDNTITELKVTPRWWKI